MRIAIAGLSIEMMLSSPLKTDIDALQEYSGHEMREGNLWMIRGILDRLSREDDVEAVPLCWATALPGGPMTEAAYRRVLDRTLAMLVAQGPFDGVLLVNHGALEVDGLGTDADGDFVSAIRRSVGPDVPIGLALDLHGDMTPELLSSVEVVSVLRTAPHRDDAEVGERVAGQLLRVLREDLSPARAAVRIPLLVPGETAVTAHPPADDLYGSLAALDGRDGLMEANLLLGFAWNDRPWTSVTAVAVSDGDMARAREAATDLARRVWQSRRDFVVRMDVASVEDGLRRALAMDAAPVFLSDSGDNTTAGAPGDLTHVLSAAIDTTNDTTNDRGGDVVVAGITAPALVARLLEAGPGADLEITLGEEHVSRPPTERRVTARVMDGGPHLELDGFQPYRSREAAWARVQIGSVTATFHAQPIGITTPTHFRAMGIDPFAHKVLVVKLGYLHPQLEDFAAAHILLSSEGCAELDLGHLEWRRIPRPMWPLDTGFDWDPEANTYEAQGRRAAVLSGDA
ncbi:M81 family metallopeptidase [Psychromarinibacter sp. C21-152]|uniref:M81 family metallopeptidase n=1 Tax=Psychromarinibacter sediminicola TaxID=3033385 RepID=A0AAE3NNE1_9RHOB|nr:M81 family metallopeptidase [Psychromarinibacter sediminicola]MDF0599466.1 M81 family metallopeptidase [Psychromarinibacter sediminicola]